MKNLIMLLIMLVFVLAGCVSSEMSSTKTLTDGTIITYKVQLNSVGQDLSASEVAVSLNPEGQTTIEAGTIDNTASQVSADFAKAIVELVEAFLPYVKPIPVPLTP